MATNGGQIKFGVGFNVDKSGLNDLKKSLQELRNMKLDDFDLGKKLNTKDANNKLLELKRTVHGVEDALKESFNADLGTLNVIKLNSELKKIGIDKIRNDFYDMGAAGQNAFRNLATEALTTNRQLKQTHNVIDKMAETLGNTLKWNISSGAINRMSGAIQEAYGFTKSLDSSLNDIMIVTGKNADEMERFAQKANQAAKSLASGTTDYTKASLIYYQQGLSDQESAARAETTLKVANVTGQNADTVSEQLTAVWNGYKVSAEEAELYIDKLSAVAADTAADLDGLSTGMSKVASAANLMGVDIDQLNATLATVVSVTQQAPESIGTAFKTIYARMGDIEAGLDTETTLGEYTKKMKEIGGISVLDENNQLREMGDVIEEVGSKWGSLSKEQQVALSQVMAGTRQYNNLLALFDNWDMYTDALNTSANAAGTLQEQQDIYMESTEAHLQQMRTSFEDLYMSLFDAETINDFADAMTTVVEGLTNFVDALGGGQGILNTFGTLATRVFSKNIAQGIATTITNLRVARENASATRAEFELTEGVLKGDKVSDENLKMLVEWKKEILGFGSLVSNEQNEQANAIIKTTNELMNQQDAWNENLNGVKKFITATTSLEDVYLENDLGEKRDTEFKKIDDSLDNLTETFEDNELAIIKAKGALEEYKKALKDIENKSKQLDDKKVEKEIKESFKNDAKTQLENTMKPIDTYLKQRQSTLSNKDKLTNEEKDAFKDINKVLKNGTEKNRIDLYNKLNKGEKKEENYNSAKAALEKLNIAQREYEKSIKDTIVIQKKFEKENTDITEQINKLKKSIEESSNTFEEIDLEKALDKEVYKELIQAQEKYNKAIEEGNDNEAIEASAKELLSIQTKVNQEIQNKTEQSRKIIEEQADGAGKKIQEKINEVDKGFKNFTKDLKLTNTIKGFIDLTAGIGQVASGIQTLVGITDIWNNQELTTGEKFIQITSALSMGLGSIVSGATAVWPVLQSLIAKYLGVAASEVTVATAAKAMWKAITGPIGLAIASIAAVGVAIYSMVKAHNADAEAAREAAKQVQVLTERYEELKTAAEEFKNSVSDYEDAQKQLENLTKGTEEYKNALENANQKARELIETYELYDQWEMKDGVITLKEGALETIKEQKNSQVREVEKNLAFSKIDSTKAELEKDTTEYRRSLGLDDELSNEDMYLFVDIVNKMTEENNGVALSAQQLMERFSKTADEMGLNLNPAIKDNINILAANKDKLNEFLDSVNSSSEALDYYTSQIMESDIVEDFGDKINDIATDENGEVNTNVAQQITSVLTNIENNSKRGEQLKEDLANVSGKDVENNAELKDVFRSAGYDLNKVKINNDEDLARLYAKEVLEYTQEEVDSFDYDMGWNKGYLQDSEGKEILGANGTSDDTMRQEIAEKVRRDQLEKKYREENKQDIEDATVILDKLTKSTNKAGKELGVDLTGAILDDLANNGEGQIDLSQFFKDISPEEYEKLINMDEGEFFKYLGITPEEFGKLGDQTGREFLNEFKISLEKYNVNDWIEEQKTLIQKSFDIIEKAKIELNTTGVISEETINELKKQYSNIGQAYWDNLVTQPSSVIYKKLDELSEENLKNSVKVFETSIKQIEEAANKEQKDLLNRKTELEQIIKDTDPLFNNPEDNPWRQELKEIENALEALETSYSIDIGFEEFDLIKNSINDLTTDSERLAGTLEKIGDSFIVAAEDAQEFIKVYPELSTNAEVLQSGELKLDKEIVNSYVKGQGEKTKANLNTHLQFIKTKREELAIEIKYATVQRDTLLKYLQGAIDRETLNTKLGNAEVEYQNDKATFQEKWNINQDNYYKKELNNTNLLGKAYENLQKIIKGEVDVYQSVDVAKLIVGGIDKITSTNFKSALSEAERIAVQKQIDSHNKNIENFTTLDNYYLSLEKGAQNQINEINNAGKKEEEEEKVDKAREELLETELDIYKKINNEIQRLERQLDSLQKKQNNLYGKDLLNNLKEQEKVSKEIAKNLQIQSTEATNEAFDIKQFLLGEGAKFDGYGFLKNENDLILKKDDELRATQTWYNNLSAEEQESESNKAKLQAAKDSNEQFHQYLERYDELVNTELPEWRQKIEDNAIFTLENSLEIFNTEVQITLDLNQAELDWNEFKKNTLEKDDVIDLKGLLSSDFDLNKSNYTASLDASGDIIKAIETMQAGGSTDFGTGTAGIGVATTALQKSYDDSINYYLGMKSAVDESRDLWLNEIDNTIEEIDKTTEAFKQLNSLYNHDMNIITMLYGEDAYERIDNIYDKIEKNNIEEIKNLKIQQQKYERLYHEADDDEEKEKWKQAWLNATDELNAKTEEAIKTILERHSKAIESTIEKTNKELTGGLKLDYIGREWDLIQKNSEQYFDSVEKGFELQNLQNSFDDAFDATDSIAGQAKINKLMEEQMKMLREKDKLTQYDVDRAQLLLDLELKKIALEEARQNKTTMRLRRDAQGNYSYQYVEDEEATKDAEREVQQTEYDLHKLDKDTAIKNMNSAYSAWEEMEKEISRIQNDTTLTEDERKKELALVQEQYTPLIQGYLNEYLNARNNLGDSAKEIPELNSNLATFLKKMNNEGVGTLISELIAETGDILTQTGYDINKVEKASGEDYSQTGAEDYKSKTEEAIDGLTITTGQLNELIGGKDGKGGLIGKTNSLKDAYMGLDDTLDKIDIEKLKKINEWLKSLKDDTENYTPSSTSKDKGKKDTSNKSNNSKNTTTNKNTSKDNNKDKNNKNNNKDKNNKNNNKDKNNKNNNKEPKNPSSSSGTPSSTPSPTVIDATQPTFTPSHTPLSAPLKNGILEIGDSAIFDRGYYSTTSDNSSNTLKYNSSKTVKIVNYRKNDNFPVQIENPGDIPVTGYIWVKEKDLYQYKTGGLVDKTGPAWLDGTKSQPELVLNSKDTQNLLDTVKILRNADSLANSLNRSMSERMEARLNTEFKRLSNMMDIIKIEREPSNDSLEQNVHIEADFPNVSDSNEIEQALMNLVNVASQYAYRNR